MRSAVTDITQVPPAVQARRRSRTRKFVAAILGNRGAAVGAFIIAVLLVLSLGAPLIAPFGPAKMGAGMMLQPPSADHLFGTDEFGRDMFSRVVWGARLTLMVGLLAVAISATLGLLVGLAGGYFGGILEKVLMRGMDVLFSFTDVVIALACVAVLGPSLQNAIVAVAIGAIPFYARVAYAQTIVERNKPYFEAAVSAGAGPGRLIFRELLPNVVPPLIVVATLGVSTSILAVSGLSFLGLGAQPPHSEWGLLLSQGRDYITRAPWITTIPGIAIAITVLGFNLFGDGLREAIDGRSDR